MIAQNKRLFGILLTVAFILAIPLVAMQFTDEVDWNLFDFLVMGTLLTVTGLMVELVIRKVKTTQGRLLIIGAILIAFLLIWIELAVGIFGSPIAGS